jgi:antitoxin component YwqK of YwqJK toxin-antitoxin module
MFEDIKKQEQDIIINVLDQYPLLDSYNIYKIIESMIYKNVEEEYENGTLKCKYTLRFGEKHGLLQTWKKVKDQDSFIKYKECFYQNGKLNGIYTWWFDNGNVAVKYTYKDGMFYGLHQGYYYNGQIKTECTYKGDHLDGIHKTWFENGQLEEESEYKDGQQKGMYKRWGLAVDYKPLKTLKRLKDNIRCI